MDDFQRLKETIETNFRLNALQSREIAGQLRSELREMSRQLSQQLERLGDYVADGFETQARRNDEVLEVLKTIGDGGSEIRLELESLKKRVTALEQQAS